MNDRQKVSVFLDYSERQGGVMPVSMAAVMLRITPQGVHSAIDRRKISSIKWRGHFFCGRKSVDNYRWLYATKFKDNAQFSQEHMIDLDEQGEAVTL